MVRSSFDATGLFGETETTTGCYRSAGNTSRSVSKQLILLAAVNRSILRQQVALDSLKKKELSEKENIQAPPAAAAAKKKMKKKEKKMKTETGHNKKAASGGKRRTSKDVLSSCFMEVERCIESALSEIESSCHKFHKAMLTYVCQDSTTRSNKKQSSASSLERVH